MSGNQLQPAQSDGQHNPGGWMYRVFGNMVSLRWCCGLIHQKEVTLLFYLLRLWLVGLGLRLVLGLRLDLGFSVKNGAWWRWALVSPDGVVSSRTVSVSASVNLPLHHKVQKFSSGTGSPGWSRKKGSKTVVVVVVWLGFSDTAGTGFPGIQ